MADDTIQRLECKLCHYRWFPRSTERPRICPHCKSVRWDVGRRFPPRTKPEAAAAYA